MDNPIDKSSKFVLYKKNHYRSLFTDKIRAFNLTKKIKKFELYLLFKSCSLICHEQNIKEKSFVQLFTILRDLLFWTKKIAHHCKYSAHPFPYFRKEPDKQKYKNYKENYKE